MATHNATVAWSLGDGDFLKRRYSRVHTITFAGGVVVPGSSSPHVVPLPWSSEAAADPEALFTASISACHMLWFLDFAGRGGFVVTSYRDPAEGTLAKGPAGKLIMTRVVLRPDVAFGGDRPPTATEVANLHHEAHEACFIANSIHTDVVIEPVGAVA